MTIPAKPVALALHGGAGALAARSYAAELEELGRLAAEGRARLLDGDSAIDVAVAAVAALEAGGLHVAGKGSSPNAAGRFELDAGVMDGATRRAGAVAALEGFLSPVEAARAVMETTPHVLLAGAGAADFAAERGLARVEDPRTYYTPAAAPDDRAIPTGTVGCVALDASGRLAAATSTGGVLKKLWGRVGDTPLIGSGFWADEDVAVCCTGQGEFFMRANAAADVAARVRYAGAGLEAAVAGALADVARLGGEGGLIAVDRSGAATARFNSPGMKRAVVHADGRIELAAGGAGARPGDGREGGA